MINSFLAGYRYLRGVLPAIILASCLAKDDIEKLSIDEGQRLLALDEGKIWIRTSLMVSGEELNPPDCEFPAFYSFGTLDSPDTLFLVSTDTICNTLFQDTLGSWSWEVSGNIRGEFTDSVKLTGPDGETESRAIKFLSANRMEWEYLQNDSVFIEMFSWFNDTIR